MNEMEPLGPRQGTMTSGMSSSKNTPTSVTIASPRLVLYSAFLSRLTTFHQPCFDAGLRVGARGAAAGRLLRTTRFCGQCRLVRRRKGRRWWTWTMMAMMADVGAQKRRSEGFLGCEGGRCGAGSGSKRLKMECGGGGGSASAKEKKDKIGERVAALQQLVSPFGKTDTASVLQEATAYIKFLHEQLQVLSAPYIQSTPTGNLQGSENCSLRSRGLCLVPVDCTLGIASSNGADIWAPVNTNRD
ncbi:hypothetical protein Taro_049448 [Colocasia esculenta]|uniref:BHLH domain-containing protein n=1 Tax=Colocasia esculenta TaxID=4460 RepID=A0A843XB35_COLES|nr:hypothetical protein [Colocasia esculenta]